MVLTLMYGDVLLDEVRAKGINAGRSRLLIVLVVDDEAHFVGNVLHLV